MTLRRFLDAAYALFVEMYQKAGANLLEAIERTNQSLLGNGSGETSKPVTASQNDAALASLKAVMAQVKR